MTFGIISTLISLALPVVIVVVVVRLLTGRSGRVGEGHGVRRFFQYLLLLGLLVVTLIGVAGLASLAFEPAPLADTGGALARGLTFTVIGGGLLLAVIWWTRSTLRADPGEQSSVAWTVYLTLAGLVTAGVAAGAVGMLVHDVIRADVSGGAAATAVIWSVAWLVHWRLASRTLDDGRRVALVLVGSLAGWVTGVIGLVWVLAATVRLAVPGAPALVGADAPTGEAMATGAGVLVAGALLWVPHWSRRYAHGPKDLLWLGYLLVVGLGASLVCTLTGASLTAYRALVWLLGDPGETTAGGYLHGTSVPIALTLVGALSWWYHRQVLAAGGPQHRTEATRVHEYLLAGIALGAAATGVALVVVALIDATVPAQDLVTGSVRNAVLAAVTLLAVGGPLWWWFWRRIGHARAAEPVAEVTSPTRRIYLVLLFGVAGVVAVVVVLVLAFLVLDDAIRGTLDAATVRDIRVPLGILLTAGTVSGYHWVVQRADRAVAVPSPAARGPRLVLLVGPQDAALAAAVHQATGARVDGWPAPGPAWDHAAVLAAVHTAGGPRVLVLSGPGGLQVVGSAPVPPAPPAPVPPPAPDPASAPDARQNGDQPGPGGQ